jgi:hypothetical protein
MASATSSSASIQKVQSNSALLPCALLFSFLSTSSLLPFFCLFTLMIYRFFKMKITQRERGKKSAAVHYHVRNDKRDVCTGSGGFWRSEIELTHITRTAERFFMLAHPHIWLSLLFHPSALSFGL